ncbi:hypothetical protein LPB67_10615 [Undibacterium sp. Jales W-56]|uniref:hypothetical protein n=1 Tax=Undibacterium sp. Jales W-56 TaxID=2897325 RepID=UPI0021CEF202|nr:hypothetical protein [Undibacterium sp. Jales W-56]MCU6434222.1 hypothetical protein [Undibacterium sp. Jales W-56]
MNLLKTRLSKTMVASLMVLMPLLSISDLACAGTAGRSGGSSSSFKGGFSSQKNTVSRTSSPAAGHNGNSSFGSFGTSSSAAPAKSTPASVSVLNRDMDNSRSQANAIKNLDARTGKTPDAERNLSVTGKPLDPARSSFGNATPASGTNPSWAGNTNSAAQPVPQPLPQTIIVQREHSSMGGMFMGFMLGQALSRPHTTVNVDGRPRDMLPMDNNTTNGSSSASGATGNGSADGSSGFKAKPEEPESLGWPLLRIALWAALSGALGWGIYKWMQVNKRRQEVRSNYTLGKV